MTTDAYVVRAPNGTITVSASALAQVVMRAAEAVEGARVRRPRRGVDVAVADNTVRVGVELAVRYGAALPELARDVQEHVAGALEELCGLTVASVDVAVEELEIP